jgi:hypothetical protein
VQPAVLLGNVMTMCGADLHLRLDVGYLGSGQWCGAVAAEPVGVADH